MTSDPARPPLEALLVHRDWVRAMARRLAGNGFDGDDLEQDAWLAAAKAQPDDGAGIKAWFAKVVRNRRAESHRLGVHRDDRESRAARPEATRGGAALVVDAEAHARVVQAVLSLDEPWRETVLLRFYEGLPPRSVAARMGVPVDTVRTRLRRAAELLRDALGGRREDWLGALAPLLVTKHVAPTSSLTATGVIAMQTTTKVAIAAAVLVAAGVAMWTVGDEDGAGPRGETASADARAVAAPVVRADRAPATRLRSPAESGTTLESASDEPVVPSVANPPDRASTRGVGWIVGRVLLPDGTPAAGAAVGGPHMIGWIAADADGRYTAEVRAVSDPQPLWVILPGYRSAGAGPFSVAEDSEQSAPDLRLVEDRAIVIRGRVVSRAGRAIASGRVEASGLYEVRTLDAARRTIDPEPLLMCTVAAKGKSPPSSLREFDASLRATVGGGGTFELRVPESLGSVSLQATVPGHAMGSIGPRAVRDLRDADLEIAVAPIVTLNGRVVDAVSGAGIEGAELQTGHPAVKFRTDSLGRFEFTPSEGGLPSVHVTARGYFAESITPPQEGPAVTVALFRERRIEGSVRLADGTPVAGASVSFGRADAWKQGTRGHAETDAGGRFEFALVREGTVAVTVLPLQASSRNFLPERFEGIAAGRTDVELIVAPAMAITGRVVDEESRAVPGVSVSVDNPSNAAQRSSGVFVSSMSRDDGSFVVNGLAAGKYGVRAYDTSDAGCLPMHVEAVDAGARDVVIIVKRGLTISGRVLDADGRPAGRGQVFASDASANLLVRSGFVRGVKTDEEGRFVVRGLPAGRYRVELQPQSVGEPVIMQLTGGESVDAGAKDLEMRAIPGGAIAGVLVDAAGTPLAREWVSVLWDASDRTGRSAQTDERGRFEIRGLPPNRVYAVKAKDVLVRDVALGTRDLVLRLP